MPVSAVSAVKALPFTREIWMMTASATGIINPGDWLAFSGQFVFATNSGHSAYWKTSGAGVAMESNPMYDAAGRQVQNSAMKVLSEGRLHVSAAFSGEPTLGLGAYPVSTGSGVGAPTGRTGVGATWQTAQVRHNSALSGTANAQQPAVATVIGSQNFGNGGTGELIIDLIRMNPDVRG